MVFSWNVKKQGFLTNQRLGINTEQIFNTKYIGNFKKYFAEVEKYFFLIYSVKNIKINQNSEEL